jgi:hypothetical protein
MLDFEYIRFNQIKANGGNSMNTPKILKMNVQARTHVSSRRWMNALRKFPTLLITSETMKSIRSRKLTKAKNQNYRLGQVVHHGSFGSGQVMALWPDGRVLVRFDRAAKNQLIFPSFLS